MGWLAKNYPGLNPNWKSPPGMLGVNGTFTAEQHEFDALGKTLVSRLQKTTKPSKDMQFAILDVAQPGAWALYASQCYGIVITTGLIHNFQTVCAQADRMIRGSLVRAEGAPNFVADLWEGLAQEQALYDSFGGLLAHIAFAFIIHHELAHAGLGHEGVWFLGAAAPGGEGAEQEEPVRFIDEFSSGAAATGGDRVRSASQALEADADLNGLRYTVQFMDKQAERFAKPDLEADGSMGIVWKHFLTSPDRKWFVILTGVAIGLYCLVSDPGDATLGELAGTTHPPLPARVLALLHAGSQLQAGQAGIKPLDISEVLLFTAGLLGLLRQARGDGNVTLDNLLDGLRINEAVQRFDEIGAYFTSLARRMAELDPKRQHLRRFPDYMCWEWYK
jgi:hypothetical protein